MKISQTTTKDKMYILGIVLIFVSLAIFSLPQLIESQLDNYFGLFLLNFGITATYFFILLGKGRLKKGRNGLHPFFLFLILFLISAYSLNREFSVFETSVKWFRVLLAICCINYVAIACISQPPRWIAQVRNLVLGISFITFSYLAIYMLPMYAVSFAGFFLFGISLHSFVPLLFCIYTIILVRRLNRESQTGWYSFSTGIASVVIFTVVFVTQWISTINTINNTYRRSLAGEHDGLPGWVSVARTIERNWVSEKILKTGIVYSTPAPSQESFFWRMPNRNFGEEGKHDPLVMIASLFAGKSNLLEEEKIKILESIYDARHEAQEQLWSGRNLFTEHIKSTVKIWPQFGLAYTEKLLTVTNKATTRRWRNQQEAIYTFYLPEGGVISSLSLWIEGRESKGILTTKEKADRSYKIIVGIESRDPSLVHWQEGNTVSVRVFPVIAGQSRNFKIGITSPLVKKSGKMLYENIPFDGPSINQATEDVVVQYEKKPKELIQAAVFTSEKGETYRRSGAYDPEWKIEMAEESLSTEGFSFDGKLYNVRPYQLQRERIIFQKIFLDVNRSWTNEEFEKVCKLFADKHIYVYNQKIVQLTNENRGYLFNELKKNQFSLFPIHQIADPETSLLVSKSNEVSPNLKDLKDSRFLDELKNVITCDRRIHLFNLGDHLSPFLKSLKEYRIFKFEHGTTKDLEALISSEKFSRYLESENLVVIDNSQIAITQSDGNSVANAPDHLMRLFTYNHILQQIGCTMLTTDSNNVSLVDEAKKAHIVTPVSSLVVLESQMDYDRFEIKKTPNSLQNAGFHSIGSVPEPHEWVLIGIGLLVLVYLKFKPW